MGLARFEKKIENMVEGAFAKAFKSGIQPLEIGRRLTREVDLKRQLVPNGVIAPNSFTVSLSHEDYAKFAGYKETLLKDLVEAVREHARDENYKFVGTVTVDIEESDDLRLGAIHIEGEVVANPEGLPGASLILPDGRRIAIGSDPVLIGRLEECAISLNDPNVSRRQAEIRRAGNDVIVIDLGSTNGTRVNGAIVSRQRLNHGDEIMVGSTSIVFEAV